MNQMNLDEAKTAKSVVMKMFCSFIQETDIQNILRLWQCGFLGSLKFIGFISEGLQLQKHSKNGLSMTQMYIDVTNIYLRQIFCLVSKGQRLLMNLAMNLYIVGSSQGSSRKAG